ncbi:hypothetical protein HY041_03110, partial [Candidatus Roizmanbacteria bacterium]|nr:hypothetical protein [Candidatus Roizmanbacteria bacterium]
MIRTKLLLLLFLLLFIAVIGKLFYLQLFHPGDSSLNNYLKTKKIYPERGNIFDHNGRPFVLNQNSYLLYLEPKKINDSRYLAQKLSEILLIPEASIESKIDTSKAWISLKSGVEEEQKRALESLHLGGIGFDYQMKRYYPEASLAAHLVGFVGKNNEGEDLGYFGLEGFYDKDLRGLPGFLETERDSI